MCCHSSSGTQTGSLKPQFARPWTEAPPPPNVKPTISFTRGRTQKQKGRRKKQQFKKRSQRKLTETDSDPDWLHYPLADKEGKEAILQPEQSPPSPPIVEGGWEKDNPL